MGIGVNQVSFGANHSENKTSTCTWLGTLGGAGYAGYKLYEVHKKGGLEQLTKDLVEKTGLKPEQAKTCKNIGIGIHLAKWAFLGLGAGAILDFIINHTRKSN